MKNSSATYRAITKITAILLLMAFLIPTGLQAKDLVEFCMMEMSSHQTTQTTTSDLDHHCDTEPAEENESEHHDCDWGFICACNIGQSQLSDKDWVPTHKDAEITLSESGTVVPFFATTHETPVDQQPRIGEHDPPLWLLYDTFLM